MGLTVILAALSLITPHATADQIADDFAVLDSCLTNAKPWKEANACIGLIDASCQAAGNYSTQEMVECIAHERFTWEAILDSALTQLLFEASETDNRYQQIEGHPTVVASLTQAQDAWAKFMDAQCYYERHPITGGSILRLYGAACFMQMAAERAIHLDRKLRLK